MDEGPAQRKRGLGMGLSALLGSDYEDTMAGDPAKGVQTVPIEFLRPSPLQPRRYFDREELDALASSIAAKGVLQPLVVRQTGDSSGQYEIIAGERRWRASQQAGVHELPIVVRQLNDAEVIEIALIENLQRQDLSAIEEAEGFRRLIDEYQHTQEQVSEIVGKSRSHVANTLRLLKLPETVREMVLDGRLSAGHARALLTSDDPEQLAKDILSRDLNVRDTEAMVQTRVMVQRGVAKAQRDPNIIACEENLARHLGLSVQIRAKRKGGSLTIRYSDTDQLDQLLSLLTNSGDEP